MNTLTSHILLATTYEWLDLILGLAGPVVLAFIGLMIHRATSRLEHKQWTNQKVIERRLRLFDEMAPLLNRVYCYMSWSGRWKESSPLDIIEAKRTLDDRFHTNRFLLSDEVQHAYNHFIDACYISNWRSNRDALLVTTVHSSMGDRDVAYSKPPWDKRWNDLFLADDTLRDPIVRHRLTAMGYLPGPAVSAEDVEQRARRQLRPAYDQVMRAFARDLEQVQESGTPRRN